MSERSINLLVGVESGPDGTHIRPLDTSKMRSDPGSDPAVVRCEGDVIESSDYHAHADIKSTLEQVRQWFAAILVNPITDGDSDNLSYAFAFMNPTRFPIRREWSRYGSGDGAELAQSITDKTAGEVMNDLAIAIKHGQEAERVVPLGDQFSDLLCRRIGTELTLTQRRGSAHAFMPASSHVLDDAERNERGTERGMRFAKALVDGCTEALREAPGFRENGTHEIRHHSIDGKQKVPPHFFVSVPLTIPLSPDFRPISQRYFSQRYGLHSRVLEKTAHSTLNAAFYDSAEAQLASLLDAGHGDTLQQSISKLLEEQIIKTRSGTEFATDRHNNDTERHLSTFNFSPEKRVLITSAIDGKPCLLRVEFTHQEGATDFYGAGTGNLAWTNSAHHCWRLYQVEGFSTQIHQVHINKSERPGEVSVTLRITVTPQERMIDEQRETKTTLFFDRAVVTPPAHYPVVPRDKKDMEGDRFADLHPFRIRSTDILSKELGIRCEPSVRVRPVFVGTSEPTRLLNDDAPLEESDGTQVVKPIVVAESAVDPIDVPVMQTYGELIGVLKTDEAVGIFIELALKILLQKQVDNPAQLETEMEELLQESGVRTDARFTLPILLCIRGRYEEVKAAYELSRGRVGIA